MLQEKIEKVSTLLEALPYIQQFHGKTVVIKYGGSLMLDQQCMSLFAADIVLLKYVGINPVVVHGGGREISKWLERLGKESVFVDGLRKTDDETMEITEMVLSGKVNGQLVSLINQHGSPAVGLSGKDAQLLQAKKILDRNGDDLGQVGEITQVNAEFLTSLCQSACIPVVSSIGSSENYETLNINADNTAAAIARSLEALKLIFMTDVEGVCRQGKLIGSINVKEAEELLGHPDISGGMLPKLECAVNAIKYGVGRVHIIDGRNEHAVLLELFTDQGVGTMLHK